MEGALTFLDGGKEPPPQHLDVSIVGKLEVIDTSHDSGKVIVRGIRRLARLAHHGKHGCQTLKTCELLESVHYSLTDYLPPIGSLGLPVVNCKKSRLCVGLSSLMVWSRFLTLLLSILYP
jgi:hypothetical protein